MRILSAIVLVLAIPAAASAQDPLTHSVTPRDVAWYMAHPDTLRQTLKVCQSNAAYMPLPDCANAESAGAGLMGRRYEQAARSNNSLNLRDPAYWSMNPIAREGVLAQCRRRAPGDELAFPYCSVAAASKLSDLRGH
jgi:hypothetical protein